MGVLFIPSRSRMDSSASRHTDRILILPRRSALLEAVLLWWETHSGARLVPSSTINSQVEA
jgi:hypothetical protein